MSDMAIETLKYLEVPNSSDCISRQAVLDGITASINQFGGRYTTDMMNILRLFTQMIQALPSAQPYTDEEIQKMQDLEQAQIDKAFELGREEGRKEAQPETCEDAVSRQAVDCLLYELYESCTSMDELVSCMESNIKILPSVTPEQRWIPCSETVDIPDHEIMACDKYGEMMFGYLVYEDGQWFCESNGEMMYDTIAWREKPEPYRGEQE